ncbi:hypothetical protein M1N55_06540 [Dehalococcoidia bacterium]|nr:hypothetical protein [Dehalococcoidia bacterium]
MKIETIKIETIDEPTIQNLADEINHVLKDLNERYSIKIVVGKGSYTGSNAKLDLHINTIGEDGNTKTKESEDYIARTSFSKLKPEWLNKSFYFKGDIYKIIGYRAKSRKYPILTEQKNGKLYKFDEETIVSYMEQKKINDDK